MNLQTFYPRPIYMGINAQDQVNVYTYFKSNTVSISNLETDPSNTGENIVNIKRVIKLFGNIVE